MATREKPPQRILMEVADEQSDGRHRRIGSECHDALGNGRAGQRAYR